MDIPDDRLDVQCLVQAIEDFIDAKQRHDAARDAYQGDSWGYFGRDAINLMNDAADDFGKRLDAYVDARIKSALSALLSDSRVRIVAVNTPQQGESLRKFLNSLAG